MKPVAIIYTSNTGHTRRYAELLSRETGLSAYDIKEAPADRNMPVIYMGWLMASTVKDLGKARRRFAVKAVCGVGLCPTGALIREVRKAARIPEDIPLFTLQGGMDLEKLTGIYRRMIDALTGFMAKKKDPTPADREMLRLLTTKGDYVRAENLSDTLKWYKSM